MGLFNGYLKEGPGVDKNAKKKKGFFLFIDIFFRKFFNLIKTNCLYILFSIPFIAVIFLFVAPYVMSCIGITPDALSKLAGEAVNKSIEAGSKIKDVVQETQRVAGIYQMLFATLFSMIIFNFLGAGPVSAAYAYITRCFTRGEHAWLLSDGKDQFKENFKYSMLLFVMNMVLLFFVFTAFYFYGNIELKGAMATVAMFARPFTLVIVFLTLITNMFTYQIMVTYECKFKDLLKNSAMIAIAKLPMCIVLAAISGGIIFMICSSIADSIIALVIYMLIGLMFTRFPIEFYAARVLEKNMKILKKRERKNVAKITYLDEDKEDGE